MWRADQECCLFIKALFSAGSSASLPGQQLRLFSVAITAQLHPKPLCAERLRGHPRPSLPLGRLLCQQVSPGVLGGAENSWALVGPGSMARAGCSLLLETPFPISHHFCAEETSVEGEILSLVLEILL